MTVTCPYCNKDAEQDVLPGGIVRIRCRHCGLEQQTGKEKEAES